MAGRKVREGRKWGNGPVLVSELQRGGIMDYHHVMGTWSESRGHNVKESNKDKDSENAGHNGICVRLSQWPSLSY